MATEKRLIDVTDENIQAVLEKVPYYPDEIWKFTAMTERFQTVDAVEVVHGRWIEKIDMAASYLAECEEWFYECSVCNTPNFGESPYCPNCGAKMDGDGNG